MRFTDYHKNILIDESNHPMIIESCKMIDNFETAIKELIDDGDWIKYVVAVTPYDKFLWECNHLHPQKTNPINILQNKKYSSFRETLLLPLWIRIKNRLCFNTDIVLNKSVVQTILSDGTIGTKDVDGGLGINCGDLFLPIIVNEDKSGHFCKTQAKNVNGILKSFEDLNNNIIRVCTTDNKVTIGKKVDSSELSSYDIVASLRKENGNHYLYQELNPEIFSQLENIIVDEINKRGFESYGCDKYKIKQKQNKSIRESIDNTGLYVNI